MADQNDITLHAQWERIEPETLYAQWESDGTVVVFDSAGGSFVQGESIRTVAEGEPIGALPSVSLSGATFAGWFTASGVAVTASTIPPGGEFRVVARWSYAGATRTLMFSPAGGVCDTASKQVIVGSAVGTLPTATRTGYTFDGWYTSTAGGTQITAATVAMADDLTVYAQWSPVTITITFDATGGTVSEPTRSMPYGRQIFRLPKPWKAGYAFLGWFTAPTGGTQVHATDVATTARTLYAHWASGPDGSAYFVVLTT